MKRIVLRIVLPSALLTGVVVVICGFGIVRVWDGGYYLTVNVAAPDELPRWVWCGQEHDRGEAEQQLAGMRRADRKYMEGGYGSTLADPFQGGPLTVHVRRSGRDSPIFGRLSETQAGRYLVVVAEMPDGRRVGKVVEIPDHREVRQLTVSIP